MNDFYSEIINLPHHQSDTHPHMTIHNRAAQFAPFAALSGHDDAINETSRLTEEKPELDEYEKEAIDRKLKIISDRISQNPEITVTYFTADEKKTGGKCVVYTGNIKKIDDIKDILIMADKRVIQICDILKLDSNLTDEYGLHIENDMNI